MVKRESSFVETLMKNRKVTNYLFLGAGLTIFVMNITAFLSFVKDMNYSFFFFNLSVFSSMIIVLFATYHIFEKN